MTRKVINHLQVSGEAEEPTEQQEVNKQAGASNLRRRII